MSVNLSKEEYISIAKDDGTFNIIEREHKSRKVETVIFETGGGYYKTEIVWNIVPDNKILSIDDVNLEAKEVEKRAITRYEWMTIPERTSSIHNLLEENWELEERILRIMNREYLPEDPDVNSILSEEEAQEMQDTLTQRQQDLFEELAVKTDNVKRFIDSREAICASKRKEKKQLTDDIKRIETAVDNLKSHMVQMMVDKKIKKIEGNNFNMSLGSRNNASPVNMELTKDHYASVVFGEDRLVKREYSWDRNALLAAYKKDPEQFKDYVEVKKSNFIQFRGVRR